MGYTRKEILNKCSEALANPHLFYREDFVNYIGTCTDTGELYTEIVAEFLCENIDTFCQGISKIVRQTTYRTPSHQGIYNPNSPRKEEITAMKMFNHCEKDGGLYDYIGKIIDYQTPLKNKQTDDAGKIDLLAYDGKTLRLLELKKPDTDETMLRCVLEGFTYLKTVDAQKLLQDFDLPKETTVIACPFVFIDSRPYREIQENRPQLKRLMQLLRSKPYCISTTGNGFKITEE